MTAVAAPQVKIEAVQATVTRRLVLRVAIAGILVVNVLNAIAIAAYHRSGEKSSVYAEFSLDQEANVPSWFSSVLLLAAAAALALVALDAHARRNRWARHWTGLAAVFVWLSMDETAEVHERIGSWLRDRLDLGGILYYAGVVPALLLAMAVALAYIRFLRALPRATMLGTLLAAGLYVTGAAGVEAMTGWWVDTHGTSTSLLYVSTVEENLELAGTTLFILVVLSYFARFGQTVSIRAEE